MTSTGSEDSNFPYQSSSCTTKNEEDDLSTNYHYIHDASIRQTNIYRSLNVIDDGRDLQLWNNFVTFNRMINEENGTKC
uniref:Uncharacterized protein n=1 Tax=Parastrongyloides trichosuri TaxID=131310 RepID=A0A0N4ZWT3_PARTI